MEIRRFVSGQGPDGTSVVDAQGAVEPVTVRAMPGVEFFRIWGGNGTPVIGTGGSAPEFAPYFPKADGGFRFVVVSFPPEQGPVAAAEGGTEDPAALLGEMERVLPGLLGAVQPDEAGLHATDTVDLGIVLEGELVLELDDGSETVFTQGSCVVQRGARHAWHNRGTVPALLACVFLGAEVAGAADPVA
ncbi:cupin domain-containing protein [Kitasatospora sp. NBC_01266]|uniref:cupin domain-containing protein n=1 Tax=Kitasatospora sp. NBC_01266 TaxID=2903572 RepID=UPI002E31E5A3|nr:cupin domain-containing protein [Kitasatospora sp. NBC_01266]